MAKETKEKKSSESKVDKRLLELLVCTLCRSKLELYKNGVKCTKCGKEFKFKDGILIMDEQDED